MHIWLHQGYRRPSVADTTHSGNINGSALLCFTLLGVGRALACGNVHEQKRGLSIGRSFQYGC